MPDRSFASVSASQVAALFGKSPYITKWGLWWAFKKRDLSLIEAPENERMKSGKLFQHAILAETADRFRLDVVPNFEDHYERRDRLGCTVDGHLLAPGKGEIVVEAKMVDWLRWKETWTETTAPEHIELQVQQQIHVRQKPAEGYPHAIIPCLVGGNEWRWYERDVNPEIVEAIVGAAAQFFDDIEHSREPEAFGSALDIPALMALYPEALPNQVVDALDDPDLAETIRMFEYGRQQESFGKRLADQMKAKLLARAGEASLVKTPGVIARISKSLVAEQHIVRKAYVMTRIKVEVDEAYQAPIPTEGIAA